MATRLSQRTLDTRPDAVDFRDLMYVPTLVEVPPRRPLSAYTKVGVPVLDQKREGACTGFGLATVANYLLRRRRLAPDRGGVSPWMFYVMARRYDEWPGEDYDGSSPRGAMKGWHRHGICAARLWELDPRDRRLTDERASEARRRPLGAYFRVNHRDVVAMHSALAEVGVLYASALVHAGWEKPDARGVIRFKRGPLGGHAFAIVGYDERGFWIQNSWGPGWGSEGFALLTYDDWLESGSDVWVARLGAPVNLDRAESVAATRSRAPRQSQAYGWQELRPHVVSLGNDGRLRPQGTYGTSPDDLDAIFDEDIPRVTRSWKRRRILLYAHGGLVPESSALQRVADYRAALLEREIYPLVIVWRTDFWSTLAHILEDALRRRRPEGPLDAAKDFLLDRLDDALEPVARAIGGKAQWDEMKENGLLATRSPEGGARLAAGHVAALAERDRGAEVHLAAHSVGAVFMAPFVELLAAPAGDGGLGLTVETCTLWAPACTTALFKEAYLPALRRGTLRRLAVFALTDRAELDDDCANLYHKSLLYLVSHAFEARPRIPLSDAHPGIPILGMERWIRRDPELLALFEGGEADWVLAPNTGDPGSATASTARRHGDFDDDPPTLRATLARILGVPRDDARVRIHRPATSLAARRRELVR